MRIELDHSDHEAIAQLVVAQLRPLLNTQQDDNELLNVAGLAEYLHVSVAWVYERSRLNEIPKIKMHGVLLFRKSDIDKWLNSESTPAIRASVGMIKNKRRTA